MSQKSKWMVVFLVIILLVALEFYLHHLQELIFDVYRLKRKNLKFRKTSVQNQDNKLTAKFDIWQPIGNKSDKFKVFAAYFEDRKDIFGENICLIDVEYC